MGKKEIIDGVKEFKRAAGREIKLEKLFIFGSAAKGRMKKNSDVDLILVSSSFRGKKFFKRAVGLHSFWKLDYPVDFLCYTPEEFRRLRNRATIVKEAAEEGIEIN